MLENTFDYIRKINGERAEAWHKGTEGWNLSDWATAFAGEAGEVCDAVKKLRRHQCGFTIRVSGKTEGELVADIADEMADAFLQLDLLARELNIDLFDAIRSKFNEVSEKHDFPQRL